MYKPSPERADKPKIVYLLGPTGVGKTDAALSVAARLQGEIVSADSMQVYRYMDIGTAKPTLEQRHGIPHHLIDVVDPDQPFDAALFREHATEAIRGILSRGNRVVVCGGTGLYLKALDQGLFHGPGRDEKIRRDLRESIRREGLAHVVEQLRRVDALALSRIDPHDERRVIRAMEVFLLTGKPLSEWHREHRFEEKPFTVLKIGLDRPRNLLYIRINRRCDAMVKAGLLDEVAALLDRGYAPELPSFQGVGYRQMVEQLKGRLSSEDAIALMRRDTRRLAKRQMTWFRADPEIVWVPADEVERIKEYCRGFFGNW
jgi:tRNA dimethylallyltransferase